MARYYQSQIVQPISQFVAEPLDFYQGKLQGMQKKQDDYKLKIDELNKDIDPLMIDRPRAAEKVKEVRQYLNDSQNINYNDPQQQKKAVEAIRKIRDEFSNFGEAGAINARSSQFKTHLKDIDDDKDSEPWMKEMYKKELTSQVDPNNPKASTLGYDPTTGSYNQIKGPQKFNKVDPQAKIDAMLEKVVTDSYEQGFSPYRNVAEYQNAWRQGTVTERTAEKINEALIQRSLGDRDLTTYLSKREQFEGINPKGENFFRTVEDSKGNAKIVGNPNTLLGNMIAGATRGYTKHDVDAKYSVVDEELNLAKAKKKEEELIDKQAWETTFSQMGPQAVNNLTKIAEAEPSNSILAKIFSFVDPNNTTKGLINLMKVFNPALAANPGIDKIMKDLDSKSKMSEEQINNNIEKITYEMRQEVAKDQKSFRNTFGFGNPMLDQTYSLLETFGKGDKVENNPEYERAREVVGAKDPNFYRMTEKQQFEKVKEEMDKYVQTSKSNVVLVPMDKKELDFKNAQIANLSGKPTDKTRELVNMGLTANGKFVDFYTGKETTLEDIVGETGQLKYMGQLENDNQFGPGMNYFQGANGKFYVSPGSLDDQKGDYINWNLKQVNNKFAQKYEFPLSFDSRRSINTDGSIPEGIPKMSITRDLKSGNLKGNVALGNQVINLEGSNEDELKIGLAKTLFDSGFTIEQIKQLGL